MAIQAPTFTCGYAHYAAVEEQVKSIVEKAHDIVAGAEESGPGLEGKLESAEGELAKLDRLTAPLLAALVDNKTVNNKTVNGYYARMTALHRDSASKALEGATAALSKMQAQSK